MPPTLAQGSDSRLTISKAVKSARDAREQYEPFWKKYRNHVNGRDYRKGKGVNRIVNYPYLFETTFLPELAARQPKIGVKPRREYTDAVRAEYHNLAINQILSQQRFLDELQLCVLDSFYAFMFMKSGMFAAGEDDVTAGGADPGNFYADAGFLNPWMPFLERVSPFSALWDDSASDFKRCSFVGHEFWRDTASVRDDERYDEKVRAEVRADGREMRGPLDEDKLDGQDEDNIPGAQKLIELFVRPTRKLYTLLEVSKNEFRVLRKDSFFGPEQGPYIMRGYKPVADMVLPLSPGAAWWDAYIEHEINEQKANDQVKAEKRVVSCEEGDIESAKRFKSAKSDDLAYGIKGIKEVVSGGITEPRMVALSRSRANLEELSAVSTTRRDNIGGETTATVGSIANTAASKRTDYMRGEIVEFVREGAGHVGWYVHNSPKVRVQATITDPMGQQAEIEIQGGPEIDDDPMSPAFGNPLPDQPTWDDFSLEIDPRTLYMDNEALMKAEAVQQAEFTLTVLRPFLNSQGFDINAIPFVEFVSSRAGLSSLPAMIVPMSPMAMLMQQQAAMTAGPGESGVLDLAMTRDPMQTQAQNQPQTNMQNSVATQQASPLRQMQTAPGANNAGKSSAMKGPKKPAMAGAA